MEKNNAKNLSLFIVLMTILLASSFAAVYASSAINEQKEYSSNGVLPDFLLRLSEYLSKGNVTELIRIRRQMIEQEKVKRDRIESTNGAVLTFSPPANPLLDWPPTYSFLSTVEFTSPPEEYGYIEDADNMKGGQDNSYAHLHTDGWNGDEENPMGGEAFAAGYVYGTWACGDIYVRSRRGQHSGDRPPWEDYVIVYVTDDIEKPFGQWDYVGYEQVPFYYAVDVYIGSMWSSFSCIAIMCWTPPPYPIPCDPLYNCVEIDFITIVDPY